MSFAGVDYEDVAVVRRDVDAVTTGLAGTVNASDVAFDARRLIQELVLGIADRLRVVPSDPKLERDVTGGRYLALGGLQSSTL